LYHETVSLHVLSNLSRRSPYSELKYYTSWYRRLSSCSPDNTRISKTRFVTQCFQEIHSVATEKRGAFKHVERLSLSLCIQSHVRWTYLTMSEKLFLFTSDPELSWAPVFPTVYVWLRTCDCVSLLHMFHHERPVVFFHRTFLTMKRPIVFLYRNVWPWTSSFFTLFDHGLSVISFYRTCLIIAPERLFLLLMVNDGLMVSDRPSFSTVMSECLSNSNSVHYIVRQSHAVRINPRIERCLFELSRLFSPP